MGNNNAKIPAEVLAEIKEKAELSTDFISNDEGHSRIYLKGYNQGWTDGATEYATKPHEFQKATIESDKQRKEANDELREAKKLLNEVFRKHESGLLPDRFIYEKIKMFLYGE